MKNFDKQISKWIYETAQRSPALSLLAKVGATYMIGVMLFAAAILVWLNPILTIVSLIGMVFVSWFITFVLQFVIRRRRPFECSIYEAKVKMFCKTPSFPSAHATIAFSIVWSMFFNEMWNVDIIFILFLVAAIWVSLSRVAVGVHYLSDVVVGALLGIIIPTTFITFGYFWLMPLMH